jgi:hypothetical protein
MPEPISDERLARLTADTEPRGDYLSRLTADEVGELLNEVKRLRAQLAEIGAQAAADTEWAVYWVDENGEPYEKQFLQDDEDEARSIVRNNHTNGRGDAQLWQRPAGEWREVPDA